MYRIFFITAAFLTCFNKYTAQIVLKSSDLKKISEQRFTESIYYKVLKSTPKIETTFNSAKTIDAWCINYITTKYFFKTEKISFLFNNKSADTIHAGELVGINIISKNCPFITEDSVKIGDRIPIIKLCADVDKVKKGLIKWNHKYLTQIYHNCVNYDIKKIRVKKLNSKTIVKIKGINIHPFSLSPNY